MTWKLLGTYTGRTTSAVRNYQELSKNEARSKRARDMFVLGNCHRQIVEMDFSRIEDQLLTHMIAGGRMVGARRARVLRKRREDVRFSHWLPSGKTRYVWFPKAFIAKSLKKWRKL